MKELTGVFLTDGVSRSSESFTVPALEDMLWLSFRKGNPSNVSHDIHRPIGWSSVSSLYVSHEMTYVLGKMYLPESESEHGEVMRARTSFLNNHKIERINQYSNSFYTELNKAGLWGGQRPVQEFKSSRLCGLKEGVPVGTGTIGSRDCT